MTWAIAGKHLFCVRAIADTEATARYASGSTRRIGNVQKLWVLSADFVVAFAGSIRMGFLIVEALEKVFLPRLDDRYFADPNVVSEKVSRFVKHHFRSSHRPGETLELLLLTRPRELMTSFGLFKLISPDFAIARPQEAYQMLEIGSGAVASEYRSVVERASKGFRTIVDDDAQVERVIVPLGNLGMRWLFNEAREFQVAGISKAMHLAILNVEGADFAAMAEEPEGNFPNCATTWSEVEAMARSQRIVLANCSATA